jgi:YHS domain-containing protein
MFKKIAVVVVVLMAVCALAGVAMAQDKTKEAPATTAAMTAVTPAVPEVVGNKVCPVSGMTIAAADLGKNTVEYKGKVYNLCSTACKDEFTKDPEKYVAKVNEEMAAEKKATEPVAQPAMEKK